MSRVLPDFVLIKPRRDPSISEIATLFQSKTPFSALEWRSTDSLQIGTQAPYRRESTHYLSKTYRMTADGSNRCITCLNS